MARGLLLTQQGRFYGQNVLLNVTYSGEGLKKKIRAKPVFDAHQLCG